MLFLRYYLWIGPHLICGAALLIAFRNKLHRVYPAFVSLLAFDFLFELWFLWAIAIWFSPAVYKWWVVIDVAATFLLELLVLYELAREVLSPRKSMGRLLHPLPRWTAAALVLIAVPLAALIPQTAHQAMNVFDTLNFGLNLIAIGLLLAMIAFTRVLGISWRGIPAGIALGFAVLAATEMAASPLMAQWGKSSYIPIDIVRTVGFHVCVLIWLVYLLLPEQPRQSNESGILVSNLEGHLQEIERMVRR